jgi:hypothetical protein
MLEHGGRLVNRLRHFARALARREGLKHDLIYKVRIVAEVQESLQHINNLRRIWQQLLRQHDRHSGAAALQHSDCRARLVKERKYRTAGLNGLVDSSQSFV